VLGSSAVRRHHRRHNPHRQEQHTPRGLAGPGELQGTRRRVATQSVCYVRACTAPQQAIEAACHLSAPPHSSPLLDSHAASLGTEHKNGLRYTHTRTSHKAQSATTRRHQSTNKQQDILSGAKSTPCCQTLLTRPNRHPPINKPRTRAHAQCAGRPQLITCPLKHLVRTPAPPPAST
jgi:hypothetical protein